MCTCLLASPSLAINSDNSKNSSNATTVRLPCLLQLLGMKGASAETNIWKIRVQLMKPVTWIPLSWGAHSAQRTSAQQLLS